MTRGKENSKKDPGKLIEAAISGTEGSAPCRKLIPLGKSEEGYCDLSLPQSRGQIGIV